MRKNMIRRLIGLALISILIPAAASQSFAEDGAWQSDYDRAVELHPKGDRELEKKLLNQIRKRHCRLQIAVNAVLVVQDYMKNLDLVASPRAVLAEVEPGSMSLLGKKVVRVIAQADAQAMDLLDSADCDNKDVHVVASFFVRLLETQRVELKLSPDRTFQPVKGAKSSSESPSITIAFRPVVSPDGKRIRLDFFDGSNSVHVFKPRSLAATMAWAYPGADDVALGPPQFGFEQKATSFQNSVEVGEGDYILVSRISAVGEREVNECVPLVGRLPLLRRFLSKRRIEKKRAQLVLLLRPVFERYRR